MGDEFHAGAEVHAWFSFLFSEKVARNLSGEW